MEEQNVQEQTKEKLGALSFEEALMSLEEQVRLLESGRASLEDSMAAFARGSQLAKQCQAKLDEADQRIRQLIQAADGSLQEAPLPELKN